MPVIFLQQKYLMKIKSLYGLYAALLVCLALCQHTLYRVGQSLEALQVKEQIKTITLQNTQLENLISQKQSAIAPQEELWPFEKLMQNTELQVIQKNKQDPFLEVTLAGSYEALVQWLEKIPGERIKSFKLYEVHQQIWCEITLIHVS